MWITVFLFLLFNILNVLFFLFFYIWRVTFIMQWKTSRNSQYEARGLCVFPNTHRQLLRMAHITTINTSTVFYFARHHKSNCSHGTYNEVYNILLWWIWHIPLCVKQEDCKAALCEFTVFTLSKNFFIQMWLNIDHAISLLVSVEYVIYLAKNTFIGF